MLKVAPQTDKEAVTIIIATFQRSSALSRVLDSVNSNLRTKHDVKICVVDNNPLPQEKRFVEDFANRAAFPIKYIHEPESGVSNARNAGMTQVDTRFVAFLDDDMKITADWVDGLVDTALDHQTGLVFGPVEAVFPDPDNSKNIYLAPFYDRLLENGKKGEIQTTFGAGGCLVDLSTCQIPNPPFDPYLNESGGEDDIFFDHLRKTGTKIGYAPRAIAYEIVPEKRVRSRFIMKRNFGYGQGPTRIHAARGRNGLPGVIRHMAVGLAQIAVYGSLFLGLRLVRHPASIKFLALTAQGFGKVFWMDGFRPKLYGASQININNRRSQSSQQRIGVSKQPSKPLSQEA